MKIKYVLKFSKSPARSRDQYFRDWDDDDDICTGCGKRHIYFTIKLSQALALNTREAWIQYKNGSRYNARGGVIIEVTEKEIFEAKLKNI